MAVQGFRRQASAALLLKGGNQQHRSQKDAGVGEHDNGGREDHGQQEDEQTPLDATLDKIGFGIYQKKLLVLCGFGWLADNMWLQTVAVILPRVQDEFDISDQWIGMLSSSTFTGMMIGAWSWGSYSDSFGRVGPFNGTLLLTSFFGILAGFASSFTLLCICFFGLGLGVGGSMPTDGTLFLENLPESQHFLLTALSVFFSMGAMVSSLLALWIIPGRACPEHTQICDPTIENTGWRILLYIVAGITLAFFFCRIFLFKLHESPKYLVTSGQQAEAVIVLQNIADQNGSAFQVAIADVYDGEQSSKAQSKQPMAPVQYARLEEGDENGADGYFDSATSSKTSPQTRLGAREGVVQSARRNFQDYMDRFSLLLEPEMKKTTLLVWALWLSVSAAYTIFNVFLPKFLEAKIGSDATASGLVESLQEFCIYTVAGFPGSLVGAYLEKRMGKQKTMVASTFATSLGVFAFVFVTNKAAVMLVTIWISFMCTLMYAVVYGYTPRLFPVAFRGSATGIASALSRLAGMTSPIVTGILLAISVSLPLYISAFLFLASAGFMLGL